MLLSLEGFAALGDGRRYAVVLVAHRIDVVVVTLEVLNFVLQPDYFPVSLDELLHQGATFLQLVFLDVQSFFLFDANLPLEFVNFLSAASLEVVEGHLEA